MESEQPHVGRFCMWCGLATSENEPPEHIVPEAIGCPPDFILRAGEVCASCNHGLAHVDQALVHDLEICAFMAGVPRKNGRAPKISSYGNFQAEARSGQADYFFNMDPAPVKTAAGKHLAGFRGKERDVDASMEIDGSVATITFPFELGRSPKFARALVKLGAEYLCWAKGSDCAARAVSGAIAQFVLKGTGYRPVIVFGSDPSKYQHHFGEIGSMGDGEWFCVFRLAHFNVFVDLTTDLLAFNRMANYLYELQGKEEWTTFPREAASVQNRELILRSFG